MQIFEIVTAVSLLLLALWLFSRTLRSKSKGECSSCDGCASKCEQRVTPATESGVLFLDKDQQAAKMS